MIKRLFLFSYFLLLISISCYSAENQKTIDSLETKLKILVGIDKIKTENELAKAYFLSFVPTTERKIAYAASFGVECWEHEDDHKLTNELKILMQDFHAVSVRENSGVDICKNIFQYSCCRSFNFFFKVRTLFVSYRQRDFYLS